jgi:hypothetical protein
VILCDTEIGRTFWQLHHENRETVWGSSFGWCLDLLFYVCLGRNEQSYVLFRSYSLLHVCCFSKWYFRILYLLCRPFEVSVFLYRHEHTGLIEYGTLCAQVLHHDSLMPWTSAVRSGTGFDRWRWAVVSTKAVIKCLKDNCWVTLPRVHSDIQRTLQAAHKNV